MEQHDWDGLWLALVAFFGGAAILVLGMCIIDFLMWDGDALRHFMQTFWRWAGD